MGSGSIVTCELAEAHSLIFFLNIVTPGTHTVPTVHLTWVQLTSHTYKAQAFVLRVIEDALKDINTLWYEPRTWKRARTGGACLTNVRTVAP